MTCNRRAAKANTLAELEEMSERLFRLDLLGNLDVLVECRLCGAKIGPKPEIQVAELAAHLKTCATAGRLRREFELPL